MRRHKRRKRVSGAIRGEGRQEEETQEEIEEA